MHCEMRPCTSRSVAVRTAYPWERAVVVSCSTSRELLPTPQASYARCASQGTPIAQNPTGLASGAAPRHRLTMRRPRISHAVAVQSLGQTHLISRCTICANSLVRLRGVEPRGFHPLSVGVPVAL
jgi:hypothetical protein